MRFKNLFGLVLSVFMLTNSVSVLANDESGSEISINESNDESEKIKEEENNENVLFDDNTFYEKDSAARELSVEYDNKLTNNTENSALVPKIIPNKNIVLNPYMGKLDASIHNDNYSTDVVNSVAPLGIYPEVAYGREPDSTNATPNAFYDDEGRAIAAYKGGIAIKELAKDTVKVLGSFIPARDDGIQYSVQTSYSFIDNYGNVVFPTSHGHIAIVRTTDDNGNVLSIFEKLMDVDIVSEAKKFLGDDIDQNLLSIVYDYNGNLWFVSGGFRKDPAYSKAGFIGYLSKEYIEKTLKGEVLPVSDYLSFKLLTQGENAENGISSCPDGVVILTNKSCYLLNNDSEVNVKWKADYDSVSKKPLEGTDVTGLGLAWGGGSTPTLTNDLVLFTDNCMPVNLIAVSIKTGEIVASYPVLDSLTGKEQVSVENSILVYSPSSDKVSVVVCNWFGAGNSNLDSPDADSSIQTYDNIYDANWMKTGNKYISPGIERIDVIKDGNGWRMEKVWTREDIRDTSMLKLSTATGYLYGYWQNIDTNYWSYYILDFDTGETKVEIPVSDNPAYNNMAVGMISDINGNALYCPTNDKVLLRLQDRFVYLPNHPEIKLDLGQSGRKNISQSDFNSFSGTKDTPVSYLNTAAFDVIDNTDIISFRVNGIDKSVNELKLYSMGKFNKLQPVNKDKWYITDEAGNIIENNKKLYGENLYELRFKVSDQNEFDLCDDTGKIKVSVILCEGKYNEDENTVKNPEKNKNGGSPKRKSYNESVSTKEEDDKTENTTEPETSTEVIKENDSSNTDNIHSNPFTDVSESAWYKDSVLYVYEKGIFNGTSYNTFEPDKKMTRGMAATVLGRMAGINPSDYISKSYTDVDSASYYAPYVEWASQNNIFSGFGNDIFKPNENITREQFAKIVRSYISYTGKNTENIEIELPFKDASLISDWAVDSVKYCYKNKIISGDNNSMFNPKGSVSRAEIASIITRIMNS